MDRVDLKDIGMASCREEDSETKSLALACEQLSICSLHDPLEDRQPEPNTTTPPKTQTPGKLRRTALRFFGVRKSICLLPALFSGRGKHHNRKGVGKSKTHDGLSKAGCCGDSPGSEGMSRGSFMHLGQRDGAQRSARGNDCSYPPAEQKSQSFPRQKKGLRGLFNSIRLHRTQRTVEVESNEMTTLTSSVSLKEVSVVAVVVVVPEDTKQTECLGTLCSPEMPDCGTLSNVTITPECNDRDAMAFDDSLAEPGPPVSLSDRIPDNQEDKDTSTVEVSLEHLGSSVTHSESRPRVQTPPQAEPPTGSSDRLDLNFEDVASLKSFDSLTGCGDIIADQDDDSLAESNASGERSRNAGKRSSCCLTYQGGGEEMASPDELEASGLRDLWGEPSTEEDMFCSSNEEPTSDLTSSRSCVQRSSATDASTLTPDALTPQSEHQESVPNSDEGYYDSTTPGPEDSQEKLDRMRQTDRIPRDSYSGDALYELFVPEENLISPHYENGSGLAGSESCGFRLGSEGLADSAFLPEMNPLEMRSNLYENHDFPSVFDVMCNKSKEFAPFSKSFSGARLQENENLNLNTEEFFNNNLDVSHENRNILEPMERRMQSTNTDPDLTRFSPTFGETKDHLDENKGSPGLDHEDDGQTVCFSQALVDFNNHSQCLRDNMDGLNSDSSLSPNMEALPAIVTFDVMDMHNEGEYDDQLHEGAEDDDDNDDSSPYGDFQESYLQKDAFAECDYQMLNSMYEHNAFSDAWAIASLPRHLGLAKGGPSTAAGSLCSDRRSRSLDREGLEPHASDYRGSGGSAAAARPAYQSTDKDTKGAYPLHDRKNGHSSAFEVTEGGAGGSFESLPWLTTAAPAPTDDKSDEVPSLCLKNSLNTFPSLGDYSGGSPPHQLENTFPSLGDYSGSSPRRLPPGSVSRDNELCNRQCNPRSRPYSTFPDAAMASDLLTMVAASGDAEGDVYYAPAFNVQSFNPFGKK